MSVMYFSVQWVVTDPPVITQERSRRLSPELELFPDYDPL